MEEVVWKKKGEERCVRSARPTEKKALPEQLKLTEATAPQHHNGSLGDLPQQLNRREEASAKMNERYLIGQPIQNPFMPNSNFAKDIEDQMNFLTPKKVEHF